MFRVGVNPEVLSSAIVDDECASIPFTGVIIFISPDYVISSNAVTKFLVSACFVKGLVIVFFSTMLRNLTTSSFVLNFALFAYRAAVVFDSVSESMRIPRSDTVAATSVGTTCTNQVGTRWYVLRNRVIGTSSRILGWADSSLSWRTAAGTEGVTDRAGEARTGT